MQLSKKLILYIFILVAIGSCIEPYFPGDLDYEPMLFIQAIVTDHPDIAPRVQLSNTYPLSTGEDEIIPYVNISGATVYIERNDGIRYYFSEQSWGIGIYYLPDPSFALVAGSSYMLFVETVDGQQFESGYEPYILPTEIEEIGYKYATDQTSELGESSEGYSFNVTTTGDGAESSYYRWELDHTYRYKVSLHADFIWTGARLIDTTNYHLVYCYMDDYVRGIYVGSTSGLTENRIVEEPLHFVSQYGDMLQIEYSLHTYQFRISQGAFQFWYDLRTLLYETGGLYETQPFRISGNVRCVSEPKVDVAGIFEVAGVSEKRIYVQRPTEFNVITNSCDADTVGIETYPWDRVQPGAWIIDLGEGVYQTASSYCFDCTLKGGYIEKPPFWEK